MISKESVNEHYSFGFKDGQRYKSHTFPNALRLSLHIDDVEYLNP